MNALLDAAALVALLRDEPAAPRVAVALRAEGTAIVAANLAEAVDVLMRREGVAESAVRTAIGRLTSTRLGVIPVDEALAWRAGILRARRYHRTRAPLSLGDCLCLAAVRDETIVLTSDAAMLRTARAERLAAEPLRDSRGRMPRRLG